LEQIRFTDIKNAVCGGHYLRVVMAIKWWKRNNQNLKHPKSYPLEHVVGFCCPDGISSVAEGVTRTLESIRDKFYVNASQGRVPHLPDYGVPEHNVLARTPLDQFIAFYDSASRAAELARRALDSQDTTESARLWISLFGDSFPKPPEKKQETATTMFTPREAPTVIGKTRFG
jgi:hypothetical protein